jgi:hypothetical protein
VSESTAPPPPPPPSEPDRKTMKADAAAAKARSKAARPWYKKKRFIIPLALLVLIVFASLAGSGDEDAPEPQTDEQAADEPAEEPVEDAPADDAPAEDPVEDAPADDAPEEAADVEEQADVGEQAEDGQFAFTVDSFECGQDTLAADNEFVDDAVAQGQFCILELTVENIGDEARSLSASDQYLYDSQERRFSADSSFEVMMVLETPIYDQINPGNSTQGTVVFDVPADAEIEFAELHDSPFSGGVLVDLR